MEAKRAEECLNQRQLVSKAKFRIRVIGKEIADLKREKCALEGFVLNSELITRAVKNIPGQNALAKLKHGQSHKKSKLKAAINGVREN